MAHVQPPGRGFLHLSADLAQAARQALPQEQTLRRLCQLFGVFADPTRLRILSALLSAPMCVGDLAALLGLSPSAVSHQLKALKDARLVRSSRAGKTVFYALSDSHVSAIMAQGLEHAEE